MSSRKKKKVKIRHLENRCPYCAHVMNAVATLGREQTAPRPGDLSLCVKCTNLCKYGANLRLARLTPAELVEAMLDENVVAMIAQAKTGMIVLGETEYVDD